MSNSDKLDVRDLEFTTSKVMVKESNGKSFKMISIVTKSDENGIPQAFWKYENSAGDEFETTNPNLLVNEYNRFTV